VYICQSTELALTAIHFILSVDDYRHMKAVIKLSSMPNIAVLTTFLPSGEKILLSYSPTACITAVTVITTALKTSAIWILPLAVVCHGWMLAWAMPYAPVRAHEQRCNASITPSAPFSVHPNRENKHAACTNLAVALRRHSAVNCKQPAAVACLQRKSTNAANMGVKDKRLTKTVHVSINRQEHL
jgi:hypothetical protein